jgi:dipeptidyl aminopeptidase/acylaminoacyl peptidase
MLVRVAVRTMKRPKTQTVTITFVTILVLTVPLILAAQLKHPIAAIDMLTLREVRVSWDGGEVAIAPDGSQVAFEVIEPADPNQPSKPRGANIWVVPTDGHEPARPIPPLQGNNTHPRWSPDGQSLAFLSYGIQPKATREAEKQIYLLHTEHGETERISNQQGDIVDLKWSPDGTMLALNACESLSKTRDVIQVDHDYRYCRLWVVNISDHRAELVTRPDLNVSEFAWSPDGLTFAVLVSATPRWDDVDYHSSLVLVRRIGGEAVRTLTDSVAGFGIRPRWSPDGRTIAFARFTPNRIATELELVPAGGGPAQVVLRDYPGTVRQVEWMADSRHLVVESNERTKDKFLIVDVSTGVSRDAGAETALAGPAFSIIPQDGTIAYACVSRRSPPEICVSSPQRQTRTLTNLNPQVEFWNLGSVQEISWRNHKDGKKIYGVLETPPDFTPNRSYPVVVQLHGGPLWAWFSGWIGSQEHAWAELLASRGYVVFLPNPRGSTGQGIKFAEGNRNDLGGMDFEDILDGVDWLVQQNIADPNRLVVSGYSYGGFLAAWAVTHTHRFKAAIVGAPITNWFSVNGVNGIQTQLQAYLLGTPFQRRSDFERQSPMTFIEHCRTPSLIFAGASDPLLNQSWEFYSGLKVLGSEVEMIIFPREGHGLFAEPAHDLDHIESVLAWYDRHLMSN